MLLPYYYNELQRANVIGGPEEKKTIDAEFIVKDQQDLKDNLLCAPNPKGHIDVAVSELNLQDNSGFDFNKTYPHIFNLINIDDPASKILATQAIQPPTANALAKPPERAEPSSPTLGLTIMLGFEPLGGWTFVLAVAVLLCQPANSAEQIVECEKFAQAVDASKQKNVPIDESLLQDPDAVTCLAKELGKIGTSFGQFNAANKAKMFRVTDALRKIMTRGVYSQDTLLNEQEVPVDLQKFVQDFRQVADHNLEVNSALSFGMGDNDPDLRLNSVLIASKTIDDNTVCVPLIF